MAAISACSQVIKPTGLIWTELLAGLANLKRLSCEISWELLVARFVKMDFALCLDFLIEADGTRINCA
jgi:hypothetical protein